MGFRPKQDMFWEAVYKDSTSLKEENNEFDDIDRDKLQSFKLEGLGAEIEHEVDSGNIYINDKEVKVYLDGEQIGISNDIINFKECISAGFSGGQVVGYYTGFKEKNEDFKYIEVLFCIDMKNQEMRLRLRVTPETKKAKLGLEVDGNLNEISLGFKEAGKKTEFNFRL